MSLPPEISAIWKPEDTVSSPKSVYKKIEIEREERRKAGEGRIEAGKKGGRKDKMK